MVKLDLLFHKYPFFLFHQDFQPPTYFDPPPSPRPYLILPNVQTPLLLGPPS